MIETLGPSVARLGELLARLEERGLMSRVASNSVDDYLAAHAEAALLLTDDPARSPESWDMAVVLPELLHTFVGRLAGAVALPAESREIAARFGVSRYPSLVVLRGGQYLGVLEGMYDWQALVPALTRLLGAAGSRPPGIGIPVRAAGADASCH